MRSPRPLASGEPAGQPARRGLRLAVIALLVAAVVAALPASARAGQSDVDAARERAQEAAVEYSAAEEAVGRLENEVAQAQAGIERTKARFAEVLASMSELAVDRYVQVGSDLELFAREDVNRQARAAAFSRLVTQRRDDDADRYRAVRQDLERQEKELSSRLNAQRQAQKDLQARWSHLQDELNRLEEAERQAAAARQAEADAQARARAAADTGSGGGGSGGGSDGGGDRQAPDLRGGSGGYCPVAGSTVFSNTWGDPRSGGRRHLGVDMWADYGTPVVAIVGGQASDNSGGAGGIAIQLDGDDGVQYYYAHLQEIAQLGYVSAGEVIGYVGDTGNAAGTPHLHFEVHPGGWGTNSNPYLTVVGIC